MKFYYLILTIGFLLSCSTARQETSVQQIPASVFSHLMPIIDSTAFEIMRQDPFLTDTFAFAQNDTMGSVYSLYLWGKNQFLHFSPNKGHFKDQLGTAFIIFQSKKPGVGEALKQVWQMHTKDSLISYDITVPDFMVLTEIIAERHGSIRKTETNHLIPMLSSYSAETYKNWGLSDIKESNMSDFTTMVDKSVNNKMFDRIDSVDLIVTNAELELLKSMLLMNGFKQHLQGFTKAGEPSINYSVDEQSWKLKVKKIKILLSEETPARIINLGRSGKITFGGKEAVFVFN